MGSPSLNTVHFRDFRFRLSQAQKRAGFPTFQKASISRKYHVRNLDSMYVPYSVFLSYKYFSSFNFQFNMTIWYPFDIPILYLLVSTHNLVPPCLFSCLWKQSLDDTIPCVCVCVSTIAFLVEIAFVDDYHCKLVVATAAAAVAFRLRSINVNNNNKTTKR